jgi:Na+/H+-dicarboxylate symporter
LSNLAKQTPAGIKWDRILTIQLFEELMEVIMLFIVWIVKITPVAIISLIANAIGSQTNLAEILKSLGFMIAAFFLGLALQFTIVYCGLSLLLVKRNPLPYYVNGIPAFTMVFASSSSACHTARVYFMRCCIWTGYRRYSRILSSVGSHW